MMDLEGNNIVVETEESDVNFSESDDNEEFSDSTPEELKKVAEAACQDLLPEKSKVRYLKAYSAFKKWQA